MKPLKPIFDSKTTINHSFDEVSIAQKKTIIKDTHKMVKIPFNQNERKLIKELAKKRGLDPTPYCTHLLIQALESNAWFPECYYDPKGQPYPAKLDQHFHDLLFTYRVQWDCSLKESAYRMVSYMLTLESRELL
jgi:hypothetical protein